MIRVIDIYADGIQAYICEGDVYMAMGNYGAAKEAYSTALKCDPTIRRSKTFKVDFRIRETMKPNYFDFLYFAILYPGSNSKI